MKTTLNINGFDYEIEIKARDKRNLNASKKATEEVLKWLEARLWEASHDYDEDKIVYNEISENANRLRNRTK